MEWLEQVLQSNEFSTAVLPASLLLGLITSVGSYCNIGIIAAVIGFAGSHKGTVQKRDTLMITICFFIGTTVSLILLGYLVGYLGELAGDTLGRYGLVFTGFASIFFGLMALDLVPFKLPSFQVSQSSFKTGIIGAGLFGLLVGMASITCTMACCGPLIPIVLGLAASRGEGTWGALILTMFAIGYNLPLAVLMLGVGLGRLTKIAQKAVGPIRLIAGTLLILVGFWLLYSA